jgi:Hermes transposase DNA-binding domain
MSLKKEKDRLQMELRRKLSDENTRLYELKAIESNSKRPDVWKKFCFVHKRDGNRHVFQKSEFVACMACKSVYTFTAATGTSTMSQHKCSSVVPDAGMMREYCTLGKPSARDKNRVTTALADFCAMDLRPFNIVAGQGFKMLLQTILDVGVIQNKRLVIDDLLVGPNTLSVNVKKRAFSGREKLKSILKTQMSSGVYAACTFGMWTDDVKKVSYMSITIHYITDMFVLHDRTLHVKPLPDAKHTAIMIKDQFRGGLKEFNLDAFEDSRFIVVSDSGPNCSATAGIRSDFDWHPCIDHKIATSLTTVFNKTTSVTDGKRSAPFYRYLDTAPCLFQMIDDVKALVAYIKQANLQNKLTTSLKQENVTRWNSLLRCLTSVEKMIPELIELLQRKNQLWRVSKISRDLLSEFITFLRDFELATLALEKFKEPTLHRVVYWRHRLLSHLEVVYEDVVEGEKVVTVADSTEIADIKILLLPIFQEKFKLETIHVVAALLDPAQKHRLDRFGVSDSQVRAGWESLRTYMENIGIAPTDDKTEHREPHLPPPAKKLRIERKRVASLYSDSEEEDDKIVETSASIAVIASQIDVEYEKYKSYKVSREERIAVSEADKKLLSKKRNYASTGSEHLFEPQSTSNFEVLTWWRLFGGAISPILARYRPLRIVRSSLKLEI